MCPKLPCQGLPEARFNPCLVKEVGPCTTLILTAMWYKGLPAVTAVADPWTAHPGAGPPGVTQLFFAGRPEAWASGWGNSLGLESLCPVC